MSKRAGRSWWMALGLGKPDVDDGDDFGDMGTAFGLDACMGPPSTIDPAGGTSGTDTAAPATSTDRHWRRSAF